MSQTSTVALVNPEKWIDSYADYLYAFAYNRVNDEETAKDLVQETFLAALKAKDSFKGEAAEKTWLVSILKNKVIDHYRKKAAHPQQSFEESEQYKVAYAHYFTEEGFIKGEWKKDTAPKSWNSVDKNNIEQKEFKNILAKCLDKLPKVWSSVFSLKYLEEEESSTICKELDITSSNYWVIIHRAKLQMRECLEKNWIKA
jgi:RNA polymerase sigma-70 factor (ECF subfamily)